jgi:hypothetical protein
MAGILDPSVMDRAGAHLKPGWRRRRAWMKVLAWLLAPLAVLAAAFQLQPTCIVLDIPVTKNPVGYLWWETQRSELAYADESGVLYVHRQVGTAYSATQGWRTAEEAFAHFERWFLANGWTPASTAAAAPTIPEGRLLSEANHRAYMRDRRAREIAHLAIWPVGGSVEGFNVVLVTSRPSWLRRLSSGLD